MDNKHKTKGDFLRDISRSLESGFQEAYGETPEYQHEGNTPEGVTERIQAYVSRAQKLGDEVLQSKIELFGLEASLRDMEEYMIELYEDFGDDSEAWKRK